MPQFGYQVLGFGGGGEPPTVWKVHKFTGNDTFVVGASGGGDVEIFAIGGGGSGGTGTGTGYMGGGGGNGGAMDNNGNGFVSSPTLPLTNNIELGWAVHTVTNGYTYDITIAAGAARNGAQAGGQTKVTSDDSGSEVYLVSFSGGGLGGGGYGGLNGEGGSGYRGGGGGGYSGGGGYGEGGDGSGFDTGYSWGGRGAAGRNAEYGGGGGGPRAHASASNSTQSGTPGAGITNTFLDGSTSVTYGQGGHGGTNTNHSTADNDGDANSGEGGDGAKNGNNDSGNGGSGIVIIRYPEGTIDASGGTESTFSV